MKVAPDCLVATWKVLGARGSDKTLKIRREGAGAFDVFSFKLAVMVVITKEKKNVCLFRYRTPFFVLGLSAKRNLCTIYAATALHYNSCTQ